MSKIWILSIFSLLMSAQVVAQHVGGIDIFNALPATRISIEVGLGLRPPFLNEDNNAQGLYGAGPEILNAMNQVQSQFHFLCSEIPAKRKVKALLDGTLDIMMWDNPQWGWKNEHVSKSNALIESKDVYIALKKTDRDQRYFDEFTGKKIALVVGYHYKMANFVIDIANLNKQFDVTMVRTEEAGIRMVIAGRVELAVTSETALNWYLKRYPQYRDKLLISEKYDTQYRRYFIVPQSAPVKVGELNRILQMADDQQLLAPIYQRYGLVKPQRFIDQ